MPHLLTGAAPHAVRGPEDTVHDPFEWHIKSSLQALLPGQADKYLAPEGNDVPEGGIPQAERDWCHPGPDLGQ